MPVIPPSSGPTKPPPPRLLAGSGDDRRDRGRLGVGTLGSPARREANATVTSSMPFSRPQARAGTAAGGRGLPLWAKRTVIGGMLLALAMPATVLLSRTLLVQDALTAQSNSKAVMRCTAGEGRALDDSNVFSWLFSGSYFSCGDWETRDARVQRDRDQAQANYLARERARQGY